MPLAQKSIFNVLVLIQQRWVKEILVQNTSLAMGGELE